ncbi:Prolyl endopeptidase precursor [Flavobacterium columnare]|uniref:Prolyl oligopeptidase family serine peptidase n=2 Tax=Flavobacterium TaxID=237 RepID=A0ABW8PKR9_9FLAO|nr:prolyl oligopeptidase family serine peptidase [Flavobacterium columnare]SPE77937.1 Prolyl endopeptidase precursor [Flavobacterium columnare]
MAGTSVYKDLYLIDYNQFTKGKIDYKLVYKKTEGYKSSLLYDDYIYSLSSKGTSNFCIVRNKITANGIEKSEIVVQEHKNEVIDDFVVTPDGLYYVTTKNGVEANLYFVKKGKTKKIVLPQKAGKISITLKNKYKTDIWFTISGWISTNQRYYFNAKNQTFTEDNLIDIPKYPEFANIVVEEIEIPAKDGKLIPISIIRNKNFIKNGENNVLLYSYGAYGISTKPNFQTTFLTWVLNGGIYIVSHVRGGGEKGDDWYKDGFKDTKANTWGDLIDTAEYLIKEKITKKEKIVIYGGSAGGITVGRALTERPDLFKVVICNVGFLNLIKIKDMPNGANNMKEFGNPDNENDFKNLFKMDAYHHINKGVRYPACFIDVGMNDARVPVWNSGKFIAKLREFNISSNPLLLSIRYDAGHSSASDELINRFADYFTFAFWQLGHPDFQVKK